MDTSLSSFIQVYQFTTGRRLFVYRQTKKQAEELNLSSLLAHLNEAHTFDLETRKLEQRWKRQQASGIKTDLRPFDNLLDRSLTGMARYCESFLHSMDPDDPMYQSAANVLATAFPNGLAAITQLPYIDELSATEAILEELSKDEFKADIQRLTLTPMLDNIQARHKAFQDALNQSKADPLNHGDIKAARAKGQEYLLQMVAIILGTYHNDKDHVAPRRQLLTPLNRQQLRIAELIGKRRPVTDVDPESGEEISETQETPTNTPSTSENT